jgi:S1-C subfamily serine protease
MTDPHSDHSLRQASEDAAALVADTAPAGVSIAAGRARLSGLILAADLVVTAEEALPEETETAVRAIDGETRQAEVIGRDPSTNVALLRVEGAAFAARDLPEMTAKTGSTVLALGAREGLPVAAFGSVAYVGPSWRSLRGGTIDARIELDLRLPRELQGGIVVDAAGAALGMAALAPHRRALVIPSATIARVARELEQHGRIRRGYVGLGLRPIRLDQGGSGHMIVSVHADGPGHAAGLRQGDILTGVDGAPTSGMRDLVARLGPESVGTEVVVTFVRTGEERQAHLTIGDRPAG